jgi:hypothetical protein
MARVFLVFHNLYSSTMEYCYDPRSYIICISLFTLCLLALFIEFSSLVILTSLSLFTLPTLLTIQRCDIFTMLGLYSTILTI